MWKTRMPGAVCVSNRYCTSDKQRLAADDAKTSLRSLPEVTAKDVFDAAKAGDAVAQELVEEVGRILGGALGSIAVVNRS